MPTGDAIYNPDVQSDIDMKNTWKLINYPASTSILSVDKTIYVDAVNGTAGGQRGTTAAFATLAQAVAVVQSGDVIECRSDLTFSGAVTISVAGVTLDFRNHTITSASQTDSRKITISADGCTVRNLELNGTWTNSAGVSTGAVIRVNNKRCTVENIYIHDSIDTGIEFNGDFSDTTARKIKINNTKLSGIYANSQNVTVTKAEFSSIVLTNIGGKGLAVVRGGIESNQVYGVDVHDVYYDTVGTNTVAEGLYIHGLTDFNISNVIGTGNIYNISLDSCLNGTVENCITRGGLGVNQFAGLELAWCRKITVSNCIFDGLSRSGSTSTASQYGGIQSSNLSQTTPTAGGFTFNNVISINWTTGLSITDASGINISGGIYSGTQTGVSFTFCDNVLVTGADISGVGSDGFDDPILVDSGAGGVAYRTSNNNYRFIGNTLNASAGCVAEIEIKSQDANHLVTGVTVKNNIRRDTTVLAGGTVKQTLGAGGSITDLIIHGNQPTADWSNDDVLSNQANTFTVNQTVQSTPSTDDGSLHYNLIIKSTEAFSVPPISGIDFRNKYNAAGDYGGMGGISVLKQNATDGNFASYVALHARENGQNITERYRAYVASGINYERMGGASGIIRASGAGSPEGVVTAPIGSVFYRTDGGTGTTFYVKQSGSGNTGWTGGVSTVGGGATIATTTANLKGDNAGNAVAVTATGTGDTVLATSPTLVTPIIGVATATSVNKWTLTAPATAATITAGADNLTYSMPEITTLIGFRHIPQNSKSANYTTVLADSGKEVYHPVGDNNARTFTIDSNANVAYPVGTVILFTNMAAANLSVAITADTMTLLGSGLTGTRTIAQYGSMSVRKDTATSWVVTPIANVT